MLGLTAARVILSLLPQNEWFSYEQPLSWGIIRNIPFAVMGLMDLMIFYFNRNNKKYLDFKWMWMAITLSFGFYIPVVLWVRTYPLLGMLMIPKTLAYVWIVVMGYVYHKHQIKSQ